MRKLRGKSASSEEGEDPRVTCAKLAYYLRRRPGWGGVTDKKLEKVALPKSTSSGQRSMVGQSLDYEKIAIYLNNIPDSPEITSHELRGIYLPDWCSPANLRKLNRTMEKNQRRNERESKKRVDKLFNEFNQYCIEKGYISAGPVVQVAKCDTQQQAAST